MGRRPLDRACARPPRGRPPDRAPRAAGARAACVASASGTSMRSSTWPPPKRPPGAVSPCPADERPSSTSTRSASRSATRRRRRSRCLCPCRVRWLCPTAASLVARAARGPAASSAVRGRGRGPRRTPRSADAPPGRSRARVGTRGQPEALPDGPPRARAGAGLAPAARRRPPVLWVPGQRLDGADTAERRFVRLELRRRQRETALMDKPDVLFTPEQIAARIRQIGSEVGRDFDGKEIASSASSRAAWSSWPTSSGPSPST